MTRTLLRSCLLLCALISWGCGRGGPAEEETRVLSGTFLMTGSATLPSLVFKTTGGVHYHVSPAEAAQFHSLQGRTMRIRGRLKTVLMKTPGGRVLREMRLLRNIEILPEGKAL